jgi:hypothetical protein
LKSANRLFDAVSMLPRNALQTSDEADVEDDHLPSTHGAFVGRLDNGASIAGRCHDVAPHFARRESPPRRWRTR